MQASGSLGHNLTVVGDENALAFTAAISTNFYGFLKLVYLGN